MTPPSVDDSMSTSQTTADGTVTPTPDGNANLEGVRHMSNEWGGLEAHFVTSLREQRVEPVPEPIVKLAQRALDGAPHPDDPERTIHAMEITFESPEKAQAFARHMRNAGLHTNPKSSITVVVDPESVKVAKLDENGQPVTNEAGKTVMVPGAPVNPSKVAWRAGERRGRKS